MTGVIIKNISNDYTIESDGKQYTCKPRGIFRHQLITPLVGDHVIFDEQNHRFLTQLHFERCM